jgi:hypothetical protein
MSEYDDDQTPNGESGDLAELRRAASRAKKLERELAEARRELAFSQAGIDTTDKRLAYFVRGYDGEIDSDSIRRAAVEAGFVQEAEQTPDPERQQFQQADQRINEAALGAPPVNSSLSPEQQLEAAMNEGGVGAMLAKAGELGIPIASS